MAEFTGERIIPGQVEADLWNEHAARYWFAQQYAPGRRVLDAGCGAGYGAHRLSALASSVTALDVAPEALAHAREHYSRDNLRFVQGSCSAPPFAARSFDLIVCFEVIEHLADWRACLEGFRRILKEDGVLVISTPNRSYYAESRSESGPNPFHVHEFDCEEFASALRELFPQVDLLTQNHADGVVFQTFQPSPLAGLAAESGLVDHEHANFFLAVCRLEPGPLPLPFVFLPSAANVLREREQHIAMLASDLERLRDEKQNLVEMFRIQGGELENSNRWAEELDTALTQARERIAGLQSELAAEQAAAASHIARLQQELAAGQQAAAANVARLEAELAGSRETAAGHITRLEAEKAAIAEGYEKHLAQLTAEFARSAQGYEAEIARSAQGYEAEIARIEQEKAAMAEEFRRLVSLLDTAEATVVQRTEWAVRLEEENRQLAEVLDTTKASLDMVKASRWVRLGNTLGVGPGSNEQ